MNTKFQQGILSILLDSEREIKAAYTQNTRTLRIVKKGEVIDQAQLEDDCTLDEFMNLLNTKYNSLNS